MKNILVVDDSVTVRMYHKQILQDAGYEIDEAENGMEALEMATQKKYDFYIVDINMALLDGYSFVQRFRKQYGFSTPIMMVSTESENSDFNLAYESGANYYQVKPVGVDDLVLSTKYLIYDNE